jgi:hypothetical protein
MGLSFDDVEMKIVFRLQKDGAATPDVIAGELKQPTAGVMVCLKELQKDRFVEPIAGGLWCVTAEYRKKNYRR